MFFKFWCNGVDAPNWKAPEDWRTPKPAVVSSVFCMADLSVLPAEGSPADAGIKLLFIQR